MKRRQVWILGRFVALGMYGIQREQGLFGKAHLAASPGWTVDDEGQCQPFSVVRRIPSDSFEHWFIIPARSHPCYVLPTLVAALDLAQI